MKFDVLLGQKTKAIKFPYLHVQVWDQDVVSFNDCIVVHQEDLGKYLKRALRTKQPVQAFSI
jgi:hypothetical protein